MPDALLLSPDDQAVNAITGVLEEMSVSCERPLDGISAAQKLSSHNYDLVLVDCENLPAAKLIFDVCRRGKNGHNPIPIAIVDGRAGLPTAFRLGAELILTKPVAKDQARSTIRTAVGRIRKDVVVSEQLTPPTAVSAPAPSHSTPVQTASVAAAAAASSPLASFAESLGKAAPSATARTSSAATASSAPVVAHTVETAPADSKPNPPRVPLSSLLASAAKTAAATPPKPSAPKQLSDDPVLAELEMAELEEPAAVELAETESEPAKATTKSSPKESVAPVFSSYPQGRQKPRGALVALLVLAIAAAGFYAAWTYDPGFRTTFQAVAQPQIDRVLVLAGMQTASSSSSAKPATPTVPRPAPALAPATPVASDSTTTATADATTNPVGTTATTPATSAGTSPAKPVATPTVAVPTTATNTVAPSANKPELAKAGSTLTSIATAASQAPLPGENTAVILSSKGAEKRLAHSVAPKYPADARSGTEGTVVLKEVVDETGKVAGVRLVEGDATLATAAMQAVKQWRYRPYVRDGKIEPFQTVVILDFQRP